MSTPMLGPTLPRRVFAILIATMFGLTLLLNPISAPKAEAAVSRSVATRALQVAAAQVGTRYSYGGTSPRTGFDCSGLTRYTFGRVGRHLPRTAQQQYRATIHVRSSARHWGDLVFFHSGSTIYHVGIYAGHGYIYHSPRPGKRVSKVKIWTSHVIFGRVR